MHAPRSHLPSAHPAVRLGKAAVAGSFVPVMVALALLAIAAIVLFKTGAPSALRGSAAVAAPARRRRRALHPRAVADPRRRRAQLDAHEPRPDLLHHQGCRRARTEGARRAGTEHLPQRASAPAGTATAGFAEERARRLSRCSASVRAVGPRGDEDVQRWSRRASA